MNQYSPVKPSRQLPDGTIEIQLTRGQVAIIDVIDADLTQFNWCAKPSSSTHYAMRRTYTPSRNTIYLHRVVLARILNRELEEGEYPDHIDNNGLNCTRSNLRPSTRTENNRNTRLRSDSTSGFKGVRWDKRDKKWRARIRIGGKQKSLGVFPTPEEAHEAYKKAAVELHGEFARFE